MAAKERVHEDNANPAQEFRISGAVLYGFTFVVFIGFLDALFTQVKSAQLEKRAAIFSRKETPLLKQE